MQINRFNVPRIVHRRLFTFRVHSNSNESPWLSATASQDV